MRLDVEMTDLIFGDDPIVTPFVWRRFFKAMRTSLEKLKMHFRKNKAWELYNDFELLEKNSLTNLKCLSVWWSDCILHFDILFIVYGRDIAFLNKTADTDRGGNLMPITVTPYLRALKYL